MRILIVTRGTIGDVLPFIALGKGLRAVDHDVSICTHSNFEELITGHGLRYSYMNDELTRFIDSTSGRDVIGKIKTRKGFFRSAIELRKKSRPIRRNMLNDSWEAAKTEQPDLLIFHPLAFWGPDFAAKLNIPVIMAAFAPGSVPTSDFPHLLFPSLKLGQRCNKLSYYFARKLFASEKLKSITEWRKSEQIPSKRRKERLPDSELGRCIPVLHAHSPSIVPAPSDWPEQAFVTGYWNLDGQESWQAPPALTRFLEQGDPPVYICFGSIPGNDPRQLLRIVLDALKIANVRGIIGSGCNSLPIDDLDEDVLGIDHTPYEWLMPKVRAVVHPGGAGTTTASLRAGRPAVICPLQGDQVFWANRVWKLGASSLPIPQKKLTVDNLSAAIIEIINDEKIRQNAARIGINIQAENGVRKAVELIEKISNS